MKRLLVIVLLIATVAFAVERQPNADYRARREALAKRAGSSVILVFAGIEKGAVEELTGFRQDENFYYLTGVLEPGAAVLIAPAVEARKADEPTAPAAGARPEPTPRPYSE